MTVKNDTSQTGDKAEYVPDWISTDATALPDDEDLLLDDDDFELMIDPDEDLDYENKNKVRY